MSQNLPNSAKFQKIQIDYLVDFEKRCKTRIYLQRSVPIQPKTSNLPLKFGRSAVVSPTTNIGDRPGPSSGPWRSRWRCLAFGFGAGRGSRVGCLKKRPPLALESRSNARSGQPPSKVDDLLRAHRRREDGAHQGRLRALLRRGEGPRPRPLQCGVGDQMPGNLQIFTKLQHSFMFFFCFFKE